MGLVPGRFALIDHEPGEPEAQVFDGWSAGEQPGFVDLGAGWEWPWFDFTTTVQIMQHLAMSSEGARHLVVRFGVGHVHVEARRLPAGGEHLRPCGPRDR